MNRLAYPRQGLQYIAGNMHVYSTTEEIRAALLKRIGKNKGWTAHRIERSVAYIRACHNRHLRLLRSVNL